MTRLKRPFVICIGLSFILMSCIDNQESIPTSNQKTSSTSGDLKMKDIRAPIATKKEHGLVAHGHKRNDPYYWLRDDSRKDEEVIAYLNAENDYTKKQLAHTIDLQEKLFSEMTDRLEPNKTSLPTLYKGYWYWSKYEEKQEYAVNIRQKGDLNADHEVLVEQNLRAAGREYYRLGSLEISSNQNLMAISEDTISRRLYEIRIKNLVEDTYYPEVISETSGEIVWANDNKHFYYVKKHPITLLPYQVYRHTLGTPVISDHLVYEELDDTFYVSLYKTRSEKYVAINLTSTMNSEVRFIDADSPDSLPKIFLPREKNHKYEVDHINKYFYALSDLNSPNNRFIRVLDSAIGSRKNWQELISHDSDNLLQDFLLFDKFVVINQRTNGTERLLVKSHLGKTQEEIQFEEAAFSASIGYNPDPSVSNIRYTYTSMTTPYSIYEYQLTKKSSILLKQDKVIGTFHPSDYKSERILVTARDGKTILVSLAYRKDKFEGKGNNPLLQYAYGSYGYTIDPNFSISRLSLMDRGFVFAIAHIRGGQMLGRQWYEDGKKLTKLNTFTDFIDVTRALIENNYADKNKVYARGGSAGGLLMGGIINMAPELYHGVIAAVPFVDVVTTMQDESIPLTTGEYDEWGNPADKAYYEYMLSYSPYDQVQPKDYPNMLVTTGFHDSQVQYWEPAKWVAKLRDKKTDNNLLLLDTDMKSGHGGKSGRFKQYLDIAKEYAFLLDLADISE